MISVLRYRRQCMPPNPCLVRMLLRWTAPLVLAGPLLLFAGTMTPIPSEGGGSPGARLQYVRADTVRATVTAGETLILPLPTTVDSRTVTEYRMIRGPALSGVAGRSVTWITQNPSPGRHDIHLRALHSNAGSDTLVVRVDVQS